jgi:hypothetical protein
MTAARQRLRVSCRFPVPFRTRVMGSRFWQ